MKPLRKSTSLWTGSLKEADRAGGAYCSGPGVIREVRCTLRLGGGTTRSHWWDRAGDARDGGPVWLQHVSSGRRCGGGERMAS